MLILCRFYYIYKIRNAKNTKLSQIPKKKEFIFAKLVFCGSKMLKIELVFF